MKYSLFTATAGALIAGSAFAQTPINVSSDITTSTTWTANNVYNLTQQIHVRNNATLTIEAGTVIASTPSTNGSGALAVTRGAQIHVLGTERKPVVFTSTNDTATWTGGDPKTGTWRQAANEWGNLTIMGQAYIAENAVVSNSATPSATNIAAMEGLVEQFAGDPSVLYGGGNDDDDSGTIKYCSFRYGGRVLGLTNELNGLSLGGIGRNTTIHHVEIMNNVDDGIEIWGGTVNLKQIAIWNIGDDSFDVDQGWRGGAQQVFIVQGASLVAGSGSGHGDNAIEIDGAEQSDYQPVTTTTIYNATVVGCPETPATNGAGGSDHGMAFRDNAHVQYRNCIFMDVGEKVVSFDNVDGDGGAGYGHNGTVGWPAVWTTAYNDPTLWSINTGSGSGAPAALYQTQTSGTACEVSDSVFYRNQEAAAYTTFNSLGLNNPALNNVVEPATMPITALSRQATPTPTTAGGVYRVISIDPTPQGYALTPAGYAAPGGFFESLRVRGAFLPGNNWCVGWTAADAFGFLAHDGWCDLGNTAAGLTGAPVLDGTGSFAAGTTTTLAVSNAAPNAIQVLVFAVARADTNLTQYGFDGVTIVPAVSPSQPGGLASVLLLGNPAGTASWSWPNFPAGLSGVPFYMQSLVLDAAAPGRFAATNAVLRVSQ
jgi:hypothetical protein